MKELNKDQQEKLLALARTTIHEVLKGNSVPVPDMEKEFSDDIFSEKRGGFVTLHIKGKLRGCIGYIVGMKNVPETIIDMAQAAAFRDPRFPALSMGEFADIDIEISVLTPIEPLNDISDITIGRDGLIISSGHRSGLLLPQVATEYDWTVEQFLEHTCFKAGLHGTAWKEPGTKIEKFSAQVFSEKEHGLLP
ncbi:MAG TPA: AmmeMemoRadiSam system protein A [Spirochaetota bacterium]|nr:AmmeMemoRadiSam system protein A [Spirochaetota bacterium]HPQ54161.1 AmmeMemoRadiSam system protein A [Spirochaetota bacterium]